MVIGRCLLGIQKGSLKMKKRFLIAGGDLRFVKLAGFLRENGCFVNMIGFDNCINTCSGVHNFRSLISLNEKTDVLVLPLPVSIDGENSRRRCRRKRHQLRRTLPERDKRKA